MAASWKHASTGNPKYVIATVNDAIFSSLSARSMRKFASIAMNRRDTSNATMKYRTVVGLIAIVRRFIAKNDIQPRVFSPSPYSPRCFHAGALTRFSSFMDLFFRKPRFVQNLVPSILSNSISRISRSFNRTQPSFEQPGDRRCMFSRVEPLVKRLSRVNDDETEGRADFANPTILASAGHRLDGS